MNRTILLGICIVLFWSCNNTTKNNSSDETNAHTAHHEEHHHEEITGVLQLNNGEKWEVNEEMKPFLAKGEELVTDFIENSKTDYKALVEELKQENKALIESCTMEGKSHEELHKWLHPHLEMLSKLEHETDSLKSNKLVMELQDSYQQYHVHFK